MRYLKITCLILIIGSLIPISLSNASTNHRYTTGTENQLSDYGYNDYYSENAFKNNLINEGYSKVYDFFQKELDLTEIGYYGRTGNPNSYDTDYVLTEEWEKYSSQYQDTRINKNVKNIDINKGDITNNYNRTTNVNNKHTEWNTRQDNKIENHENRIGTLEDTQYNLMGEVNILQGRRWKFGVYGKYNLNRNVNSEAGLKITISLGDSWEAKEIDKVNKRLQKLENKLKFHNIETETVQKDKNTWTLRIKDKNDAKKVIRRL